VVGRTLLAGSLALTVFGGCDDDGPGDPRSPQPRVPTTATVPSVTSTAGPTPRARGAVSTGPVVYVSDGDTIGVRLDGRVTRIRLLGIDAPETKDPRGSVECFGPQASAIATRLLPRRTVVTVLADPSQDERDRFGRLLAYVFRPGERTPVNETLIAEGAARVYVFRRNRPFRRLAAFRAAESSARAAGRGLWSVCPAPK
jgi:micrococcal nuclease